MYSERESGDIRTETSAFNLGEVSLREESLVPCARLESYSSQIGHSLMRFEPPDIGYVRYVGDLTGEVVFHMNAALELVAKRVGHIYLLVDLGRTGNVSEEARLGGLRGMRTLNPRATAVFGTDFHVLVIATLITKAAALIDARLKGPVSFFSREIAARAWLAEIRKRAGSNPF